MPYTKRVWENTREEVTYEDFNRIEEGIEANDLEISKQKDATKDGTLAKQIADMNDQTKEGSLAKKIADAEEQINDCLKLGHTKKNVDLKTLTKNDVGEFYVENGINTPPGVSNYGYVKVSEPNIDGHLKISYTPCDVGTEFILLKMSGVWGEWKEAATKEKIVPLWSGVLNTAGAITLSDDITKYNKLFIRFDVAGVVGQKIEVLNVGYPLNFGINENLLQGVENMVFKITSATTLEFTTNNRYIYSIEGGI